MSFSYPRLTLFFGFRCIKFCCCISIAVVRMALALLFLSHTICDITANIRYFVSLETCVCSHYFLVGFRVVGSADAAAMEYAAWSCHMHCATLCCCDRFRQFPSDRAFVDMLHIVHLWKVVRMLLGLICWISFAFCDAMAAFAFSACCWMAVTAPIDAAAPCWDTALIKINFCLH